MEKNKKNLKYEILNEETSLNPKQVKNNFEKILNKSTNDNSNMPAIEATIELKDINLTLENLNIEVKENEQNKENNKNISKISVKTQYKIYLPFVTLKIILSTIFMFKYILYIIKNEDEQKYCKYSILVLSIYVLFCYYLVVFTKSFQTNVNKYFSQDVFTYKPGTPGNEIQDLNLHDWKECPFCRSKKYLRCSHCRICNKCILMRDHHCPYVANCIGFKNIQYFFNFIFWANIENIYYISSFIKYMFFSVITIKISIYIKIILFIDLFLNCFFIININGILIRLLIAVYNNWTQKENMTGPLTENYCPIHSCCVDDEKELGKKREINYYNIGFLSHLYHLIGPTIMHLFFPLPKYKNYNIDENSHVFKKIKLPNRFEMLRFMVKNDPSKIELLNGGDALPDNYIKLCHQYYEGKNII